MAAAAGAALAGLLLGGVFAPAAGSTPTDPTATASSTAPEDGTEDGTETDPGTDPETEPAEPVGDPLRVVLHRLQPAVLPEDPDDEVTVSGTVRNRSDFTWTDLQAYLVSSPQPLTSAAELATAVASDPAAEIGDRIVEPGLFGDLADLDPGEVTDFRLSVPRSAFGVSGESGVYWLGVHVLGTVGSERDVEADGRARTFLPLVPRGTEGTELAVAAQFRSRVVREPDGRLEFPDALARRLTSTGRLRRLLALSRTTRQPLTWVVDPAVLEAVGSLAEGNPPYDAEPDPSRGAEEEQGDEQGSEDTGGSGDAGGDTGGDTSGDTGATDDDDVAEDGDPGGAGVAGSGGNAGAPRDPGARRAARWLGAFSDEARQHQVLTVPYGDLDVAAAYSNARGALTTYAHDVSARVLEAFGVRSEPVVVPPSGYLPADALTALSPEVLTVLSPAAVPSLPRPLVETSTGTTALVTGTAESTRGPGPGAPRAALAVRQRLLAEAALHALSADRTQPVLALLPGWWDPGPRWREARFFGGLGQRWLRLVEVEDVRRGARPSQLRLPDGLVYPDEQADAELGGYVLDATADLITQGATYESVFVDLDSVGDRLGRQALLSSSVWTRQRPLLAADRARSSAALVETLLDEVAVRSPPFVTMSSEEGEFLVTLANGLQERIRVGLRASVSGTDLQLTTPDTVTLEPNERRSVRIGVRSSGLGIHRVVLQPTTETGLPVGAPATLSVRSSSVGMVLWFLMAGGSVVLFGAIAVRIVRRVRRRQGTHGPLLRRTAEKQPEGAA